MLWVGLLNACLGAMLILAPSWDPAARNALLITMIVGYAAVLCLAIAALWSPNYGPGIYICIPLWAALLAWTVAVQMQGNPPV